MLSKFFKENKNWSKIQIKEISENTGLKENKINEDIKKISNELNLMKINDIQINNLKLNKINENINKDLNIINSFIINIMN